MAIGCAISLLWAAVADPAIQPLLDRVSAEARILAEKGPKFIGVETMSQRARTSPPRFRFRRGADPADTPAAPYRTTELVSEYRFGSLPGGPDEIREIRVVTAVNGRPVRDRLKARLALSEGMASDMDRFNKQMLQDLESHGMIGAVTDAGQLLLMFVRPKLADFEFQLKPDGSLDGEAVTVLGYRQMRGASGNVYHRSVERLPLAGELWIRKSNGQPVRVIVEMPSQEGKRTVVHRIAVDYAPAPRGGVLLPATVEYSRHQEALLMVEMKATYTDFKMFSAEAEIKFEVEEEPAP
jgi:hypothetical protein